MRRLSSVLDRALRGVARTFQEATRPTDIVCRWGGEEFVIAFPHTHLEDALVAAERIRARIEATAHELPGGGLLHVTASIGVSTGVSSCARRLPARVVTSSQRLGTVGGQSFFDGASSADSLFATFFS